MAALQDGRTDRADITSLVIVMWSMRTSHRVSARDIIVSWQATTCVRRHACDDARDPQRVAWRARISLAAEPRPTTTQPQRRATADRGVWCLSSTTAQLREVLDTLHATGALANAVVAVASDNGGCPADGASNWPLRGTKFSSFEVLTLGMTRFRLI